MTRKVRQNTIRVIIAIVISLPILIGTVCLTESFHYPRIARSAYWRHPELLMRATRHRLFPGKGVSPEIIAEYAQTQFKTNNYNIRLLYLADAPEDDTTIRARTFATLSKFHISTNETLFWIVTPRNSPADEPLAYEYRTGKLVCGESLYQTTFALE